MNEVGQPLYRRGSAHLDWAGGDRIEARLRVPGADDILVTADADGSSMRLVAQEGPATIESDAAVRALLIWGRRPADASRWHSDAGPEALRAVRTLLSGY
ncbi:hypothetical protein [Streptomyces sp. NPDC047009]|uniref:hypothetical protein n=1 Tax=unclassified Streptomyces TaxID=2593676 RepID=UPI0033C2A12B